MKRDAPTGGRTGPIIITIGIRAFGVDRILMEFMNETNVREVVAFPKNGSGVDVMMNSPSIVDPAQLTELGL